MFHELLPEPPKLKPNLFITELTPSQYKFIAKLMPKEYMLELITKPKRKPGGHPRKTSQTDISPLKKVASNKTEGTSVSNMETKPTIKPPAQVPLMQQFSLPPQQSHDFYNQLMLQKSSSSYPQLQMNSQMSQMANFQSALPPLNLSPSKEKRIVDPASAQPKKAQVKARKNQSLPTATTAGTKPFKPKGELAKRIHQILQRIKKSSFAEPFLSMPNLGELAHFYKPAPEQMDLNTIEKKLMNNEYTNLNQFNTDMSKIWNNAWTYNPKGSDIYIKAIELATFFERIHQELEAAPPVVKTQESQPEKKAAVAKKTQQNNNNGVSYNYGKITFIEKQPERITAKQMPLAYEEKKILHQNLSKLKTDYLKGVWDIVNEGQLPNQVNRDILEFDLDNLPIETARKLERFVNFYKSEPEDIVAPKKKEEALPESMLQSEPDFLDSYNMSSMGMGLGMGSLGSFGSMSTLGTMGSMGTKGFKAESGERMNGKHTTNDFLDPFFLFQDLPTYRDDSFF